MAIDKELLELRKKIDASDNEILKLLNQRAQYVQAVGKYKTKTHGKVSFYCPEREFEQLHLLCEANTGPLENKHVSSIFRQIISGCFALEHEISVAYLGPQLSFSHMAALKQFGDSTKCLPIASIDEIFNKVESKQISYGIVPIENSNQGSVNNTLDNFVSSNLKICSEVEIDVQHALLAGHDIPLADIQIVYGHQQALAQCNKWLNTNLPHAKLISVSSNSAGVEIASKTDDCAAIASVEAASNYNMQTIAQHIANHSNNSTRFVVIGNQDTQPTFANKTSLLVLAHNQPGALYKILSVFYDLKINLCRIETRPSILDKWNYSFYIDLEGHIAEDKIQQAISRIEQQSVMVKNLGSYPKIS